jgi:HlyD family secretion protein
MTSAPANAGTAAGITSIKLPDSERVTSGGSSRMTRFVIWGVLFLLIGGSVVAYRRNPPWLQELRGSEYKTATVTTKGPDNVALEASGYVVPCRQVRISPRVPGAITLLNFEVGQKVKKGELLAQLDDSNYQADIAQAEAAVQAARSRLEEATNGALPEEVNQARTALDVAKSKLELVTNELDRAEQLGDSVTQSELDQLLSAKKDAQAQVASLDDKLNLIEKGPRPERMKAIQAEVKQAEALLSKARYLLDNTRIVAPLDGTILEKNAEVGEILRPEVLSVSLCSLADMSTMEVEIDVQERELQKVSVGQSCTVIPDAYPNKKYTAKIDRIQPQVIRARGVVRVTIRITTPDEYLLPEMNVRAILDRRRADRNVVDPRLGGDHPHRSIACLPAARR